MTILPETVAANEGQDAYDNGATVVSEMVRRLTTRTAVRHTRGVWLAKGGLASIMGVLVLHVVGCGRDQHIPPSTFAGLRVYRLTGFRTYSDAFLKEETSRQLDPNKVVPLLRGARYKSETPMWKGSKYAELTLNDGRILPVSISSYGGFFEIQGQPGIYVIDQVHRDSWDTMINRTLEELFEIEVESFESRRRSSASTGPAP